MNIKAMMDRVLFALSVPKCVCCKTRLNYGENALCLDCSAEFEEFKTRNCSRCARKLNECDCSNDFLEAHYVKRVIKCFRYLNRNEAMPGNALIYSLKRDNRLDVLKRCADELEIAIRNSIENPSKYIFTNVPRRKSAIIEHGIDHSAILSAELAKRFNAEYRPLLKSNAKKPQKSLETADRFKNADFYISKDVDLTGKAVILVDDIITSGASMSKAASLIRSLGCREIIAASLAIAYKDSYNR